MQWRIISALFVAGMVCVDRPVLHAQASGLGNSDRPASSRNRAAADKDSSSGSTQADRRRVSLSKRAETTFQNATVLRDKQTAKGLAEAVKLFGQSARLFEFARVNNEAADAYVQAGEIHFTLSQYEQARRSFRKALNLGTDREVRCKASSRMSRTYATTGPSSLADQYSSEAMNLCDGLSEQRLAEALQARGEALDYTGQHLNNEDYYVRARNLFAAANDTNGQAQALLMIAYHALFSDNKQEQGLDSAAQALQLWSSVHDQRGIARMRSLLATFAVVRGEYETAQCNYKVSIPIFRDIGDKDNEGVVLNGLGYVSWELGDWQKSLEQYQNARAIFAGLKDQLGEIEAISGMGKALTALKSYKSVLSLYSVELRLARQMGDPLAVAHALQDMAVGYEAENRYSQAESFYRSSLNSYRAAKNVYSEGEVLIRLGHLQANQKRYEEAINSLEQGKTLEEKIGRTAEVARVWYELAYIYRQLNRLKDAQFAIENSIEIIEKQRVKTSDFESRASYFASVHLYYTLYIQVLMSRHRQEPALGYAAKAFEASERSKVRSLLDLLTTSDQDAPCDELLRRQLEGVNSTELRTVDVKDRAPSGAPTLTLPDVQAEIGSEDTVLLEYALGDEKSYVWIVDQHRITSHELPKSARIREAVDAFRKALVPPQLRSGESAVDYQTRVRKLDRAYQFHAQQLSRLLLEGIPLSRPKRILIVPDESLQYVPFAALPLPSSGTGKDLLVSQFEVDVLPSASVLGILRKATGKRAPPTATAAIFADPVFEPDDVRVSMRHSGTRRSYEDRPASLNRAIRNIGGSQYIARLPASRDEANAIASVLRSGEPQAVRVALDFDASRAHVLTDGLTSFRLLHFATHGIVDARHPEMSGLILSLVDRRGRRQDGYLRLGDIYKLKLSADLVVLSSCDSALGKDVEAEGIIGLPRGFLYAGAKSVIASLWKVNDDATATLMSRLYARIKKGDSPGLALRGAQLEMLRDEQWSNPYYWAAFVLQGDYK